MSYTNFTFPLFFDLILGSFILISFRLCDASAFILFFLFCYPQPLSLHPPSSVPHPPFCPPSFSFPSSVLRHPLITSFHILSSNSLPLHSILFLSSQHLFITPCLPILTLSTLHSVPCDSVSHSYILHTTPSLVVYKSF